MLLPLLGLISICLAGVLLARWGWGRYLSAPAIIIMIAMLASNTGVLPIHGALYSGIVDHIVPASIPLLLAHANLRHLWLSAGPLVLLFLLAAAATMVAGVLALLLLTDNSSLAQLVPVFVATYVGGSVNFVAASQTLIIDQPDLVSAALAADAVVAVFYLVILATLSNFTSSKPTVETTVNSSVVDGDGKTLPNWLALTVAILFSAAVVVGAHMLVWLSDAPSLLYLYIIALAVMAANVFSKFLGRIHSAPTLGVAGMYLFFAVIGSSTQLSAITLLLLPVLALAALIVIVHATIFFGVGRFFYKDVAALMTISNACILGPASAAAVASSRGWHHLVAPGTLCGVLGYVIANFLILLLLPLLS